MFAKKIISLIMVSIFICITIGNIRSASTNVYLEEQIGFVDCVQPQIWRDTAPIHSMVIGDIDQSHVGDEILCGGESSVVTLLAKEGNNWIATVTQDVPGTVEFLDIGYLDPANQGNCIAVGTFQQHSPFCSGGIDNPPAEYWGIRMLSNNGGEWTSSLVFSTQTSSGKLWSLRVGDFDSSLPGDEIVACWEFLMDVASVYLYSYDGTIWTNNLIYSGNMVIMDANVGEFNSSHRGNEIILIDEDGDYIQLNQEGGTYEPFCIWDAPDEYAGRSVEIGDVDQGHFGNELVIRTRFIPGVLLLSETNNRWSQNWILRGSTLVSDLVIHENSNSFAGNDVFVVRDKNVTRVWKQGQRWYSYDSWHDSLPLTCVASGDFDTSHRGDELAVAGESQNVSRVILSPFISIRSS